MLEVGDLEVALELNRVQVVEYGDVQFTKNAAVLEGMRLGGLGKSEAALEGVRRKGLG